MESHKNNLCLDRLEDTFEDFKPALNETEANLEAYRCLQCFDAPCIRACPTGINIPQFIHRIGSGNVIGAARTILDSNIFGHSCALACPTEVLCEGACVYHSLNKKPILIGRLQRFAVEDAYKKGVQFYHPGPATGKKVALVGAGPASLACAHELRKLGHETVVFEKKDIPGGLNTQGIAPYKMKAQTSLEEIEHITQIGIQIEYGKELGRNLHIKDLTDQYDAVFLGLGLGPDSIPKISGAEFKSPSLGHSGIQGAVEWITQIKTLPSEKLVWLKDVQTALVIGGGNTALDACRELVRLRIPRVIVSYRRGESDMSGYTHEFKYARQEGVEFRFYSSAIEMRAEESNRVQVLLQEKAEQVSLTANLVLFATGQSRLDELIPDLKNDAKNPKIFIGGDFAYGGMEVVNAVASGKKVAQTIHERMMHG